MAKRSAYPVVVATDGSPQARAAVAAAAAFPWPRRASLRVVMARGGVVTTQLPGPMWAAVERGIERIALGACRVLRRHWPAADFAVVDQTPVEGVLAEARRLKARAVVCGVRGQGAIGRFVLGSVSRGVVRQAPCAALVVKGQPREMRRLVIGLDGSAHSRRAVEFVSSLAAPAGGRVALVRVVEPVRPPTTGLLPATVRAVLAGQAEAMEAQRVRAARREVEAARRRLERSGWVARAIVRTGLPLRELLRAVGETRAHVLVVGARGVGGIERLLLGSVAEGALSRSPVSVLIVR